MFLLKPSMFHVKKESGRVGGDTIAEVIDKISDVVVDLQEFVTKLTCTDLCDASTEVVELSEHISLTEVIEKDQEHVLKEG